MCSPRFWFKIEWIKAFESLFSTAVSRDKTRVTAGCAVSRVMSPTLKYKYLFLVSNDSIHHVLPACLVPQLTIRRVVKAGDHNWSLEPHCWCPFLLSLFWTWCKYHQTAFLDKTRCQSPTDSGEMLSQCHSPIQETLLELQFYFNWWEYPEVRSQKRFHSHWFVWYSLSFMKGPIKSIEKIYLSEKGQD